MSKPRFELKRVGIFSAVKTLFVLGGFTGLVLGILQWMIFGFMFWAMQNAPLDSMAPYGIETELLAGSLGGMSGIIFPITGGMGGAIVGVFAAFLLGGLYNMTARILGGLEFEWAEVVRAPVRPVVPVPSAPTGVATPLPSPSAPPPAPEAPARDNDDNEPPRRPSSSMYE